MLRANAVCSAPSAPLRARFRPRALPPLALRRCAGPAFATRAAAPRCAGPRPSSLGRCLGLSAPGLARASAALLSPARLAAPPGCGRAAARAPARSAGSLRSPLGCSVRPPLRSGRPPRRCGLPLRSCAAARRAGPPVAPGRLRLPAAGSALRPRGLWRGLRRAFSAPAPRAFGVCPGLRLAAARLVPPRRQQSRVETSGCAALDSRRLRRQMVGKRCPAGCARGQRPTTISCG